MIRYKAILATFFLCISNALSAQWLKVNSVDYTWGPFKIYNISLFTETGEYQQGIRPLMLTLKYERPVDGRDFAITLSKSWSTLGIALPEQNAVIDRLKKSLPDFKPEDSLSYIALEDKGYFVLNDKVLPEEFMPDFNDAILAIWLDPKSDFRRFHKKLLVASKEESAVTPPTSEQSAVVEDPLLAEPETNPKEGKVESTSSEAQKPDTTQQAPQAVSVKDSSAPELEVTIPKAIEEQKVPAQIISSEQEMSKETKREPIIPTRDKSEVKSEKENTPPPLPVIPIEPKSVPVDAVPIHQDIEPDAPEKEIRPIGDPQPKSNTSVS